MKNYYRRITESLPQGEAFTYFATQYSLLFLAISLILSSILVGSLYLELTDVKAKRKQVQDSFSYWGEVAEKHPNSPDAFFEAGYYAARLGDRGTASKFLDEALKLDPSFEKAKILSQQLTHSIR